MKEEVIYKQTEEISYIQFKKLLQYGVKHAYTLKGENIDFSTDSEKMPSSYAKICDALKIDYQTLVIPKQTHTDKVTCIRQVLPSEKLSNTDGLITNQTNITLCTKNADCILFLLYDPVQKVIANVHSGWRGTFQKIVEKAVVKMITFYGCKAKDIICCICPSIRKCHFEVDEDVKDLCESIFGFTNQLTNFIAKGEIKEAKQKYLIDTVEINKILLRQLGMQEKNIIDSHICSVCEHQQISSSRVEGKNFTRATAIITL